MPPKKSLCSFPLGRPLLGKGGKLPREKALLCFGGGGWKRALETQVEPGLVGGKKRERALG